MNYMTSTVKCFLWKQQKSSHPYEPGSREQLVPQDAKICVKSDFFGHRQ